MYICRMKESVRILRFIIVGTLNALITALVIWVLMEGLDCNYLWSNVAGYVAALINNFFWSKYWIFSARSGKFQREIPLFLIAFGCAYGPLTHGRVMRYERISGPGPRPVRLWCRQFQHE